MRFHLLSDIHLEFAPLVLPGGDNLLLSGDITVADYIRSDRTDEKSKKLRIICEQFFGHECAKYKQVYYIMGNHEHYSGIWENTQTILRKFVSNYNIKFLEKESVILEDDIVLWGGTLWTDMNQNHPMNMWAAKRGMNDYRMINKFGGTVSNTEHKHYFTLTPEDTIADHVIALNNLKEFVAANKNKKIIIMTHMAPSPKSSHPRYDIGNPLNWAYYSELSEFILNNPQIKVWVHGHTHDSHDYMIGETRVICNPRGYAYPQREGQENILFDINFNFEV